MNELHEFSSSDVEALRTAADRVHRAVVNPDHEADSFGLTEAGVKSFLRAVEAPGVWRKLRAYVYRDYYGGYGVFLAAESGSDFPDPDGVELDAVRWPEMGGSRDFSFMRAIEGDGSPRSYLEASIFAREALELGAFWHGLDWHTEAVLDEDFRMEALDEPFIRHEAWHWILGTHGLAPYLEWRWILDRPSNWNPVVLTSEQSLCTVRFFSHNPIALRVIYANVDMYAPNRCEALEHSRVPIAEGGAGKGF